MKLLMAALLIAQLLAAQDTGANTGSVGGVVVDKATGAGIEGVTVTLIEPAGAQYKARTDTTGGFLIDGMKPGVYAPRFEKPGYIPQDSGGVGSALYPVTVGADADQASMRIELTKFATIRGRVLNPEGKPAVGVVVEAAGLKDITDADGRFNFANVTPGAWTLRARPSKAIAQSNSVPGAQRTEAVSTWFPSVLDSSDAEKLIVRSGADLSGYEIRLRAVPVYPVRGVVLDQDGKAQGGAEVSLAAVSVPRDAGLMTTPQGAMGFFTIGGSVATPEDELAHTDQDGSFEFPSVRAGTWHFVTHRDGISEGPSIAVASAVVDHDIEDLRIRVIPPFKVQYSVEWAGTEDIRNPRAAAPQVISEELPGRAPTGFGWTSAGDQVLGFSVPGRYQIMPPPGLPGGYYLFSLTLGGQEILGQSVYVVPGSPGLKATYKPNAGTVRGTCGGAELIVAIETAMNPSVRSYGRMTPCAQDGAFTMESLGPGDYYLWGLESINVLKISDPDLLRELLTSAVRVSVKERSIITVDLQPTHLSEAR